MNADLDWRTLPLSGSTLIEASAGTGKTYNIALIYLRLLLERGLGAREILVTTFTEAAAEELKARIRARLSAAARTVDALLTGTAPALEDASLDAWLRLRVAADGTLAQTRLKLALSELDLAPISTIHGYCRRVLTEFPFDTGMAFNLGEIVDQRALVRECVDDYWRQRFLGSEADPWAVGFVLPAGPADLAQRVASVLDQRGARIELEGTEAVRLWWQQLRGRELPALARLVADTSAFRANSKLLRLLTELHFAAQQDTPGAVDWDSLYEYLTPEKIVGSGRQGPHAPLYTRPLLQQLQAMRPALQRLPQRIHHEWVCDALAFVERELERRLRERGQLTFDQLITAVHARLQGPRGAQLAEQLAATWPAALIDEFQDTDARQWQIFERLHQAGASHLLVLIGDPKQAIYAFRGGDIQAYLQARAALPASSVRVIRRNFRSHPALLGALNQLYALAGPQGFGASPIAYQPVQSGKAEAFAPDPAPLCLRLLNGAGKLRDEHALQQCADDIAARLADPEARLGGRQLKARDIAVLVNSNWQITQLRRLLLQRQVPVVGSARSSVIQTEWAEDLQLLLYALLNPGDSRAVRGAMATRLLGATSADLIAWASAAGDWEQVLEAFAEWRQLWERRGPLEVIERILARVAPRLLAAADGERALTDLRHLGEILQTAASDCYGPEELYTWFVAARRDPQGDTEEASRELQLRIESQADCVQLLTVHASKGLEFPLVYLPLAWLPRSSRRSQQLRYHDAAGRLCLDLGSADYAHHQALQAEEDLQERLRKLYVALTRAIHRCVVYAPASLPAAHASAPESSELECWLGAALAAQGAATLEQGSTALMAAVPGLLIEPVVPAPPALLPAQSTPPLRSVRGPMPSPRAPWGLYSYTALTRRETMRVDLHAGADDEPAPPAWALPAEARAPHPQLASLQGLKGPRFGDAVHALLETTPPPYARQGVAIQEALRRQGLSYTPGQAEAERAALAAMLDRTVQSELAPGLRLASLPAEARRAEFEFAFALAGARVGRLHQVLDRHGLGDWWPVADDGAALRGLMKGYLDLAFAWDGRYHVLDYKTNWLGDQLEDYQGAALDAAMRNHHYGLQALIYSVALHRFLATRLDDYRIEQHLGGAWYLFVRALGLAPGAGLWYRRFPEALVLAVDGLFDGAAA